MHELYMSTTITSLIKLTRVSVCVVCVCVHIFVFVTHNYANNGEHFYLVFTTVVYLNSKQIHSYTTRQCIRFNDAF